VKVVVPTRGNPTVVSPAAKIGSRIPTSSSKCLPHDPFEILLPLRCILKEGYERKAA
jgi:hypothetical protein